jgi:putative oxidoreductase
MTSLESGPAVVRPLKALVPLLTRVLVAQVFLLSALHKFEDLNAATAAFAKLQIPAPNVMAIVVATLEGLGGLAILLGLFTRWAAFLLCGVMVVALGTAHRDEVLAALVLRPEMGKGLTSIAAVVMLGFLGWLLAWGPGPISVDRLRWRRRNVPDDASSHHPHRSEMRMHSHREKIEPSRARAEREHMLPSRSLGPQPERRRDETAPETGGPMSGRLRPEEPPEIDAPGTTRL